MKKITIRYISDKSVEHSFLCDNYTTSINEDVLEVWATFSGRSSHIILNTRNHLFFVEEE